MTTTHPPIPHVWDFILSQMPAITRISKRISTSSGANLDDLTQDVIVKLHDKHQEYSTTKSSPATWIYWVVRECATKENRKRRFHIKGDPDCIDSMPCLDNAADIENKIVVSQLRCLANEGQKMAMDTIMFDMSTAETVEYLGVSSAGRNARLYRFRKQIFGGKDAYQ